jgi:hypothetical protein
LIAAVGQFDIELNAANPLIQQHRNFNQQELAQRVAYVRTKFNPEQQTIFEAVKQSLDFPDQQDSNMYYIDGPGI